MYRKAIFFLGIYIALSAVIAGWVYFDALNTALRADREAGAVRLSEASSRLRGQLDVYRALVNITARDPQMAEALELGNRNAVTTALSRLSLTYGAWEMDLTDKGGNVIASSAPSHIGYTHSSTLMQAAKNGRMGYSIEHEEAERLVRFSRSVVNQDRSIVGVVVVSANLAALEFEWPLTPEPIIFFDADALSISANRLDLASLSMNETSDRPPFPLEKKSTLTASQLWNFVDRGSRTLEVQVLSTPVPQLEMTSQILLSTENARATASLRLGLAIALLSTFALMGAVLGLQRRRLAMESELSAMLEQRVEERTQELQATQSKLVEASNLAALGRLSAGISHELNQPLAAILNYAENGKRLIAKSRKAEASENLSSIAAQIRRITRIITNLRAFARQEHTPIEKVDLGLITKRVLDQVRGDLDAAKVDGKFAIPDHPIIVMGGNVRLEQVVLNLVTNALDAMQETKQKILAIEVQEMEESVALVVRDTGSGVKEPDRVFEPFYTTKELGASKGLGMGMALSFGLVSNFGGTLACRNLDTGAEFTMTLPKANG